MSILPPEVTTWMLAQGPAGVIIFVLIGAVVYLFKRFDGAREELIAYGAKYAEVAVTSAKAIEASNENATAVIEAVQTFKLLSEFERRRVS